MSESDQSSHWQFLVNILGAKPKEEPTAASAAPEESPESAPPEAPPEPPRAARALPEKPAKPTRPKGETLREKLTHWSTVLKSVGVEPPAELESPEVELEVEAETPAPAPVAQGPPTAAKTPTPESMDRFPRQEAEPVPPVESEAPREAWPSPSARETSPGERTEGGRRQRRRGRERVRSRDEDEPQARPTAGRREDHSPPVAESVDVRFEQPEVPDVEPPVQAGEAERPEPERPEPERPERDRPERGRRRRRGRRGRRDREGRDDFEAVKPVAEVEEEFDDEFEAGPVPRIEDRIATPFEAGEVEFEQDDEEQESAPERSSRRRRRRRRPRTDRPEAAESGPASVEPLEVELDDEDLLPARLGPLEEDDERDDDIDLDEEEARGRAGRVSVPSWSDAISDIIARNMAGRQRTGGGGGARRGRGRGGRRPGPRERS